MPEIAYPKPIADVIKTLTDICHHQKRTELVELLENSHAHFDDIDYDNWNGGTTTWALRLEVSTHLFASAQPDLDGIEKELHEKLRFLDRLHPNDPIGQVTITPLTSAEMALGQRMAPSDTDVRRLWGDSSYFRLFLSHVSLHKVAVSKLKSALFDVGISAFVAHEDIEPSQEWQDEISLALRSMHALAALVTAEFHDSKWTDQEVGWALGRGVPVLPVRLGADPYGFVGKIQAIPGALTAPDTLADAITKILLRTGQVRSAMRTALVVAFELSSSFAVAKRLKSLVLEVADFREDEKDRLRKACSTNRQVRDAHGVPQAIYNEFGATPATDAATDDLSF
jgi:hypothetical protein